MSRKGGERIQTLLSESVMEVDNFESIETLAGADVSYKGADASAASVVMDLEGSILQETVWKGKPSFPYISSFFALREFPLIYRVLKNVEFDLLFVHGHGRAHPRRFGLACHTGLYLGKPTIGVANRKLIGEYNPFETWTYLYDRGSIIGAVLRTHAEMNPIFVSVGHMISLDSAIEWTFKNVKSHKFPEVLRLAHRASKKYSSAQVSKK